MLENVGFTVGPVRMVRQSAWLRWSAKLSARSGEAPGWHRLLGVKPMSRLAAWYGYLTSQSDCIVVTAQR
jgi:hypothetical protein